MQKRNKILGFALFAVAFATWGVLFSAFKGNSLTLFPNCNYEIYALTDEAAGGFSTSEISIGDSAISARINIRSGKAYPYAGIGFNLTSLHNRPTGPFDFSRFDSIAVTVSTGRMRTVTLRIWTMDPVYSTQGKYLTYRPLETEISVPASATEAKVAVESFKNKEWWLAAQGLDKDDGLAYFFLSALFEVFNGEGTLRGIPDDIEVRQIRMWGENRDFIKGMYFGLAALVLLLAGFIYMAFRKRPDSAAFEKQMKEAARLLKQTDKSVAEIAIAVGAKSAARLEKDFCRLFGKKPLEYRKKDA